MKPRRSFFIISALLLSGCVWYLYPQGAEKEAESLAIEKIVVTPMEGKIWRESEARSVVAFCPEVSKHRPVEWKPWARVRVYFQRTAPDLRPSSRWYGSLSATLDDKGRLVPSACVSSGPIELDRQGKIIELPESVPLTSPRHHMIDFEISLPPDNPTKGNITFRNRIAHENAVLPVYVTIPRNVNR